MIQDKYPPIKVRRWSFLLSLVFIFSLLVLNGCASNPPKEPVQTVKQPAATPTSKKYGPIHIPEPSGTQTIGNDLVTFDISDTAQGYYYVTYTGTNGKIKLQVTGPDSIKYTYNLDIGSTCLTIPSGNGKYDIALYENISGDQYSTAYKGSFEVTLKDEFLPFLYPNKHVNFTATSKLVPLAKDLVKDCGTDLDAVGTIYHYITTNISYDKQEAETVAYNYVPDLDEVLDTKVGICYDYASLMAGMLRSLSIPTKLQIGYAGSAYHAWISTYIEDIGWIDDIIQFDGSNWSLMDPTFAANSDSTALKQFIGDGTNYKVMYTY